MHRSLWSRILSFLQSAASLASLGGGFLALAWLGLRLEQSPTLRLGPWPEAGIPLVVVDAGHGGQDGGAVANGQVEKHLALALAVRLRQQLEARGLRVKMTRHTDVFLTLEERSRLANDLGAAAFVSLHLNTSVAAPEVMGMETYFSDRGTPALRPDPRPETSGGERLAKSVQRQACRIAHVADRGIKEKSYAVVAHTDCPAVLVECGFLTHPAEAARLAQSTHQERLAEGIASGVAEFLQTQAVRPRADRQIAATEIPAPAAVVADTPGRNPAPSSPLHPRLTP